MGELLCDGEVKTVMDCMTERAVLTEREKGLHQQFEALLKSLEPPGYSENGEKSYLHRRVSELTNIKSQLDSTDRCQPPGAYPDEVERGKEFM